MRLREIVALFIHVLPSIVLYPCPASLSLLPKCLPLQDEGQHVQELFLALLAIVMCALM